MRVAIDGKRYYLNSSGIGRYSRSLIDQLNSIGDEENLELFLYKYSHSAFSLFSFDNYLKQNLILIALLESYSKLNKLTY